MIAFEIFVNGKKVCAAGVGDDGVLLSALTLAPRRRNAQPAETGAARRFQELGLRVGGAVGPPHDASRHVEWLNQHICVGDEITIRVIETEVVDKPSVILEPLRVECSFCGKKQDEVDKIVGGAQGHICDQCLAAFLSSFENGAMSADELSKELRAESEKCLFCGKAREEVKAVFSKDDSSICIDCLKIYQEKLSDYAQTGSENPTACGSRKRYQVEAEQDV